MHEGGVRRVEPANTDAAVMEVAVVGVGVGGGFHGAVVSRCWLLAGGIQC